MMRADVPEVAYHGLWVSLVCFVVSVLLYTADGAVPHAAGAVFALVPVCEGVVLLTNWRRAASEAGRRYTSGTTNPFVANMPPWIFRFPIAPGLLLLGAMMFVAHFMAVPS